MPLFDAITNTEAQIWRRDSEARGGDTTHVLMHRDLKAFADQVAELERTVGGRTQTVTVKMLLPPQDLQGRTVDVQAGDEIRYKDYRDVSQSREVVTVMPVHTFGWMDHIVVELS